MLQRHNEMMDFMWSMFQRLSGMDNRELPTNQEKKKPVPETNDTDQAPLAEFDTDDFSISYLATHFVH